MARPTEYSPELADTICTRLAAGESLRKICNDEAMPNKSTVLRWLAKDDHREFRDQYGRARELQADFLADEILEIADDASRDKKLVGGEGDEPPVEVVDHEQIQRSRLRVDARKWYAGKVAPKKYGDRVLTEHSGPRGGPVQVQNASLTPEQVRDELANIFGADTIPAIAAALPIAAAELAEASDRVVHADTDDGGEPFPGTAATS